MENKDLSFTLGELIQIYRSLMFTSKVYSLVNDYDCGLFESSVSLFNVASKLRSLVDSVDENNVDELFDFTLK